jgi:hypothetical protein
LLARAGRLPSLLTLLACAGALCGCSAPWQAAGSPRESHRPVDRAARSRPRAAVAARSGSRERTGARPAPHARIGSRGKIAIAERTHEYPAPPPRQRAPAASTPQLALLIFATIYINWNASNVAKRLRALAHASIGQARSAMQLEAAQVTADPQLRAGGIANHGTVEGIAPLLGGAAGEYVVVTREWTTASATGAYQGLLPAWHATIATVRREGRGWVVSGWQPES